MERFSVGETLVYDIHGLCRVREIKGMSFIKTEPKRDYYVLEPITGATSLYYVPVENERAVSKLRRPLTKDELDEVLSEVKDEDYRWIENRQLRSEVFHSVLAGGITPELISLIRCIYCRKEELSERGKRLSATDEGIFSAAEKLLNEEFAFVLGIEKEKVSEYISSYFLSKK
ncbi:MAG: CarD family transcriptional regulator [Clostridia bacterium]|nr:CarD family transcriptional regulator [Clostridia bacterium]